MDFQGHDSFFRNDDTCIYLLYVLLYISRNNLLICRFFLQSVRNSCHCVILSDIQLACMQYILYKLVRFYEPSSRATYETTRATLSVFSMFVSFPCDILLT